MFLIHTKGSIVPNIHISITAINIMDKGDDYNVQLVNGNFIEGYFIVENVIPSNNELDECPEFEIK